MGKGRKKEDKNGRLQKKSEKQKDIKIEMKIKIKQNKWQHKQNM